MVEVIFFFINTAQDSIFSRLIAVSEPMASPIGVCYEAEGGGRGTEMRK